jgi:hypothetical protein
MTPYTAYFTLGQDHVHRHSGRTLDCDTVLKITAADPRSRMFELFGSKWAMQYDDNPPDMRHFKEIVEVQ